LILNLINHSDIVWFSSDYLGVNEAHYHHCNEQPLKFWRNLFNFYDYDVYLLPEDITIELGGRGNLIAITGNLKTPRKLNIDGTEIFKTSRRTNRSFRSAGYRSSIIPKGIKLRESISFLIPTIFKRIISRYKKNDIK
ncbi:hypothetical protein LCGC14_2967580, partial [marine sediment metagenome]